MISKRKIAVVTGSRADYGLLYWLLHEIKHDQSLELQVIVTGMHLSPEFGNTYKEIETDGFDISYKVDSLISSDSSIAITKSVGLGVIGFADAYSACQPDIIVLLGDRHEIFAAGMVALTMRIPMAHIHGGETTPAMLDDPIRHCLTKMAHLHFPASDEYAKRICQLGEDKKRIFCFGGPGLDHLERLELLSKTELEQDLGVELSKPFFVITYHPVTFQAGSIAEHYQSLLEALDNFENHTLIFTCSNADHEGREVFSILNDYKSTSSRKNIYVFTSLGFKRYISLVRFASAVIGNSSSGLIEIPHLGVPTVNIGDRQKSRLKANTVIDCKNDSASICDAIKTALSPSFQNNLLNIKSPYKKGNVSFQIKEILKSYSLESILEKPFVDMKEKNEEVINA
jgi:GDP/UDP-N,N'-diacetylbacillosamine 2-epimerase (hydrolysing)